MSVLMEFSMTPLDKGESVGKYVARSIDIVDQSSLPYKLGPMGTCVEGSWEEVMQVVSACLERMQQDCSRISISMKADVRKGKSGRIASKIESVQHHLGREVRT